MDKCCYSCAKRDIGQQKDTIMVKKKRETKKHEFFMLTDAMKQLNLADTEFSRVLGYSDNAVATWRKTGFAPCVAVLAAEALVRRINGNYKPPTVNPSVVVALVNGDKKTILITFLKG